MAILKIHSQINTADNVADLRYFGYDGISYKDVDEFVTSIAEDDNVFPMVPAGHAISEAFDQDDLGGKKSSTARTKKKDEI